MKIRRFVFASALVLAGIPGFALAAKIVFVNQSSWAIHEIYFAPSSQTDWGDDHLGNEILETGDSLTLTGVNEGRWDVMLVDEGGYECIVEDVEIDASERVTLTDEDLAACIDAS